MKKIILFVLIITTSFCSTIPQTPFDLMLSQKSILSMEEMNKVYPFWNLKLRDFYVDDLDAGIYGPTAPLPTPQKNKEARFLSIANKKEMLKKLNTIRFVVNTPEFADRLRREVFYSSKNATGPFGTIKKGDKLDSERLIKVLQKASFHTTLRKSQVQFGGAAEANVGSSLYVAGDEYLNNASQKGLYIDFPNKEPWDSFSSSEHQINYVTTTLFHELLHNMGFEHDYGMGKPNAVSGMEGVFNKILKDPKWQKKYQKQLAHYNYYVIKYSRFLEKDDIAGQKRQSNPLESKNIAREFRNIDSIQNNDEIEDVCIVYEDGTYQMVQKKNGRII